MRILDQLRASIRLLALTATLVSSAAAPLRADILFQFADTGLGFTVTGTLTAIDNGNGSWTAISGSGLFNGDTIVLVPGQGTSPSGAFVYNSYLFPTENPLLDGGGLLFIDTVTGHEMNIWGNGPYPANPYSTYTGFGADNYFLVDNNSDFSLEVVTPEPATWTLLALGLGLTCLVSRRRAYSSSATTRSISSGEM